MENLHLNTEFVKFLFLKQFKDLTLKNVKEVKR